MSGLAVPLGKLWRMKKACSSIHDTQVLSESKAPSVMQEGWCEGRWISWEPRLMSARKIDLECPEDEWLSWGRLVCSRQGSFRR